MRSLACYQISTLTLVALIFIMSCAGPNTQICHPSQSQNCLNYTETWGKSLDRVVVANFPDEIGFYKPVVHKANFLNAWVTTGSEINISLKLLKKLDATGRICVISHELAHLKNNHYYSKIGISVFTTATMSVAGSFVPGLGYLNRFVNPVVTNTFGRQFELNADRLAVKYIQKAGLEKYDYVEFLYWMKKNLESSDHPKTSLFSTHPATQERIEELIKN